MSAAAHHDLAQGAIAEQKISLGSEVTFWTPEYKWRWLARRRAGVVDVQGLPLHYDGGTQATVCRPL